MVGNLARKFSRKRDLHSKVRVLAGDTALHAGLPWHPNKAMQEDPSRS